MTSMLKWIYSSARVPELVGLQGCPGAVEVSTGIEVGKRDLQASIECSGLPGCQRFEPEKVYLSPVNWCP